MSGLLSYTKGMRNLTVTSKPTVRIERLLNTGQFYGMPDADYYDLRTIIHDVAAKVAVPENEVNERLRRLVEHTLPPSIFLVARNSAETILGFIVAEVGNTANTSHVGWLRIDVHPGYQDQGIGRELLEQMLKTARDEGLVRLEITSYGPNYRARQFFITHGFYVEGCHPRARRDPATGEFIDTYTLGRLL